MKLPSGIRCLTFAQSNERSHSSGLVRVCVCVCVAHTIKTNAIHAKQTRVSVWSFIPSTAHRSACRPGCMCYLALCFRSLFPMAALLPHVCSLSLASESFVVRMRFSLRRIALCRMPHFEERPTARNTYTRMQKQKIVHVLVCTPHPIQLEQQQRWMNACVCVACPPLPIHVCCLSKEEKGPKQWFSSHLFYVSQTEPNDRVVDRRDEQNH